MRVDALYLFDFGFEVLKILAYPQYVSYPVSQNPEFVSRSGQPFYLFLIVLVAKSAYVASFREHGQDKIKCMDKTR